MSERVGERRRDQRLAANQVFAAFTVQGLAGSDQGFGVVRNVSASGVLLVTPQPPHVPATVVLRISVGEELFEFTTQARRVMPTEGGGHAVGLEFVNRDQRCDEFLARFRAERPDLT